MEHCDAGLSFRIVGGRVHEYADAPCVLSLLGPCRGRPRARAAEQRDELAPFHLTKMHPIPHGPGAHRKDIELQRISQRVVQSALTISARSGRSRESGIRVTS